MRYGNRSTLVWLCLALFCSPPLEGAVIDLDHGWLRIRIEDRTHMGVGDGRPLMIRLADRVAPVAGTTPEVSDAGGSLTAVYNEPAGRVIDIWEPLPELGPAARRRTIRYVNTSDATQDLLGAYARLMPLPAADAPDPWTPRWFHMRPVGPDLSICVAWQGTTDLYDRDDRTDGVVEHEIRAQWRLEPGQTATLGHQVAWLAQTSDPEALRAEAQRFFEAVGFTVPRPVPDWLPETILYEVSAGGHLESRFSDVGGFDNLARQIPYLHDLGVTALWLNAVHRHKTPPNPDLGGWNHYDPLDFEVIDTILGGAEGLARLTQATYDAGIRIIGEIVPHGGQSRQALALPEWWTRGRDGNPIAGYGSDMDYASPAWQGVMAGAVGRLAAEFGMEGVRIDVADSMGPNWGSPRTNHASFTQLGGTREMLAGLRDAVAAAGRYPVLIPESTEDRPEFFAITPASYGLPFTWFLERTVPRLREDPAALNAAIREYLERERGGLPAGALPLRTLGSHDEVSDRGGRVSVRFGSGLARALYGVCLALPGIPMLYQESEVGSFAALAAMNHGRRMLPEMAYGSPDYTSVSAPPEVFTCLRSHEGGHALALVNLSAEVIESEVRLPALPELTGAFTACDAVSGRSASVAQGRFDWRLSAYETALIRLGASPEPVDSERLYDGQPPARPVEAAPFSLEQHGASVTIRQGTLIGEMDTEGFVTRLTRDGDGWLLDADWTGSATPSVRLFNVERWLVSARSGLLDDRLLRRHDTYPTGADYRWDRTMIWGESAWGNLYDRVSPTGRLWQSFVEPLSAERPALAFTDAEGRALGLEVLESTAGNIVLTDRTDEDMSLPYALELRFHPLDVALSPSVRLLGRGQPWKLAEYPGPQPGLQRLRLRIVPIAGDPADALEAPRQAIRGQAARFERDAATVVINNWGIWLTEPTTIRWTRLNGVPGRFRLRLELRHSERSADGTDLDDQYTIALNGRPLRYEWSRRATYNIGNAWFGYVLTEPVDLDTGPHELSIQTGHTWCAMREPIMLMAQPERSAVHRPASLKP